MKAHYKEKVYSHIPLTFLVTGDIHGSEFKEFRKHYELHGYERKPKVYDFLFHYLSL